MVSFLLKVLLYLGYAALSSALISRTLYDIEFRQWLGAVGVASTLLSVPLLTYQVLDVFGKVDFNTLWAKVFFHWVPFMAVPGTMTALDVLDAPNWSVLLALLGGAAVVAVILKLPIAETSWLYRNAQTLARAVGLVSLVAGLGLQTAAGLLPS